MGSETRLRALHVIPSVAPRYGGPSLAVMQMCRALRGFGVDVLVATTDADGLGRLPVTLARVSEYQAVRTIFFPRQWSESLKCSMPLAAWLRKHVAEFDVVHIHAVFSHSCLAAASACRRHRVPYLVRPLGTLDPWSLRQKPLRKWVLWRLGANQMLRAAAAIHYTTAAERRLAEGSLGLQRGVVIPIGVDDALLADGIPVERFRQRFPELGCDPYVVVLSRLHPKKGLELLLEAFGEVVRGPDFACWRLVIAGAGDAAYVTALKALAARISGRWGERGSNVLFTGWLDGEVRLAALGGATLFALPSRQENFGLAVAEAMASGTPVLVSPHVNLSKEIEAAGAGWVAPLDRRAWTDALKAILSDAPARHCRGIEARQFARDRFAWRSVAQQLIGVYGAAGT